MQPGFEQYSREIEDGLTEWEPPIPFEKVAPPRFPTEKLPLVVSAMVESVAEALQVPEEMPGLLSLGVLATLFQRRYCVEINSDWRETLSLYTVCVAPPGERKSGVLSALTRPILEFELSQRELDAPEIAKNQTERRLLEGRKAAAEAMAAKAKPAEREARRKEALELAAQLAGFHDMHELRLLLDDATPEQLINTMSEQNGAIAICSGEGGVFFDSLRTGRYDKLPNLDVYLKAHAGDYLAVDRVGRRTNYIKSPRLSMLFCVQPELIEKFTSDPVLRGRGLCARFLYSFGESMIGHRKVNPEPVPETVRDEYRSFIFKSLAAQGSGAIRLSPDADDLRQRYQQFVEELMSEEMEHMRDFAGKLVGSMIRIAALLHCGSCIGEPAEERISVEQLSAAISIAECLRFHAMRAYASGGADRGQKEAEYLWRRITALGSEAVTKRDLFNCVRSRFSCVADLESPLSLLEERGFLRQIVQSTGGRPTVKIVLNPLARGQAV